MKLSKLLGLGGGSAGIRLAGLQPSQIIFGGSEAVYKPGITNTGVNIGGGSYVQLCNITPPAGSAIVLLAASLSGMPADSNPLDAQIEVDGVTVLTGANTVSGTAAYLFGSQALGSGGASYGFDHPALTKSLLCLSNLKIRAKKTAATNVTVQIIYLIVEA